MEKRMHPRDRCRAMLYEAEQMIIDIQSYNDNHPDDPPFDCERERVIATLARKALGWWDAGFNCTEVFRPLWEYVEAAYSDDVESEGPI